MWKLSPTPLRGVININLKHQIVIRQCCIHVEDSTILEVNINTLLIDSIIWLCHYITHLISNNRCGVLSSEHTSTTTCILLNFSLDGSNDIEVAADMIVSSHSPNPIIAASLSPDKTSYVDSWLYTHGSTLNCESIILERKSTSIDSIETSTSLSHSHLTNQLPPALEQHTNLRYWCPSV